MRRDGEVEHGDKGGDPDQDWGRPRASGLECHHPAFHDSPRQTSSPPSTSNPKKKHRRKVGGCTRARSHPPSAMPASAGTRASKDLPVLANGSAPCSARPPASAKVEMLNESPSACTKSSRSSPSEPR